MIPKKPTKSLMFVGCLMIFSMPLWAQRGPRGPVQGRQAGNASCYWLDSIPLQTLEDKEKEGLFYMREEEKLARDVYMKLHEKWGATIFSRIIDSEQRHMDMVKVLLDRYGLADPVGDNAVGIFKDTRLTLLFEDLVAKGLNSYAGALKVGATIEDLDIHDLDAALETADNTDLKYVYENLRNGSCNHIRAFAGQLKVLGIVYATQYISQEEWMEIIAASRRNGRR